MPSSSSGNNANIVHSTSAGRQAMSFTTIIIALLLALCFVGLSHDASYLSTSEEMSVERGAGIEQHKKFEKDVNAAPPQRKIAFVGLLLIGLYCACTYKRDFSIQFGPTAVLIFACLVLVVISLVWSIEPRETAKEIVRIFAYGFVAFSLALRMRPRELCFILATIGLVSVMFAVGAEVLTGNFRPWQRDYRMHGTLHTNVLASHAVVTALVCFAFRQSSRHRRLLYTIMIAMLAVVVLSKTRGALATSCVGMGTMFFARKSPFVGLLAVCLLASAGCLMVLLYAVSGSEIQQRVQSTLLMGRSKGATTLTGRLPLWQELWHQSKEHRWMGFGYGAFWTIERMEDLEGKLQWYPGHAHSVYMQTMLDLGVVGLSLFVTLAITCVARARNLFRKTQDSAFCFYLGMLTAAFVDGLVEVSYVYPRGLGLLVAMVLFGLVITHAPATTTVKQTKRASARKPAKPMRHRNRSQLSY